MLERCTRLVVSLGYSVAVSESGKLMQLVRWLLVVFNKTEQYPFL